MLQRDAPQPRIAIGCVADDKPKFLDQAVRLMRSIRWFGGALGDTDLFFCLVGELPQEYVAVLNELEVIVTSVERFSDAHPHSNKLRFLELPQLDAYDTVVLLDCDIIVTQPPLRFLNTTHLQAKTADLPTVPRPVFERVFSHFGIELPPEQFRCTPSGDPTIWYCNAGVLSFPKEIFQSFVPRWREFNEALVKRLDLLDPVPVHCDQASLALAFAAAPVPFQELPIEYNYPLHIHHEFPSIQDLDPVLIHYHSMVDHHGLLQTSPHRGVLRRIDHFNRNQKVANWHAEGIETPNFTPSGMTHVRWSAEIRSTERDNLASLDHPTFVVGAMRSGTTALANYLGQLEGITHCPFELKDLWSQVAGIPMACPKTRDTDGEVPRTVKATPELQDRLIRAFRVEMCRNGADPDQTTGFLTKNPHLSNKIHFVAKLFEDARFIWIHRPMQPVVASLRNLFADVRHRQHAWHYWPPEQPGNSFAHEARGWNAFHYDPPPSHLADRCFPGGDIRFLAEYWLETNEAILEAMSRLPGEQTMVIDQTQLVKNPSEVINQCGDFLRVPNSEIELLPFDPARNESWKTQLDAVERGGLADFCSRNHERIDDLNTRLNESARRLRTAG